MPTGHCKFPEHHSPAAGPPFALLGAIALGAVVIAFAHAIVVALVVVAVLASVAGAVFLLIHNHGSGYDPELERQAAAERSAAAAAVAAPDRTAALETEVRELRRAVERRQLEAAPPATHNHLHLHGLSAAELGELVAERPAIERSQQW